MKLAGLVFLGLIASSIAYALLFLLFGWASANFNTVPIDDSFGIMFGFLVILPLAFFVGGFPTGYFSYSDIDDKLLLAFIAPALYVNFLWMGISVFGFLIDTFMGVNPPGTDFLQNILIAVLMGIYWYFASAAGVLLGFYLHSRLDRLKESI